MRDIPQNETFSYDGYNYQCIQVPRKFWPCQNCALMNKCANGYGRDEWPACKAQDRADRANVVFAYPLPKPRVRRDRRDDMEEQCNG